MVQCSQHGDGDDGRSRMGRRRWRPGAGDSLPDALVRPRGVDVGHVLPQHAPQLPRAEDEEMVEALVYGFPSSWLSGALDTAGEVGNPPA